MKDFFAVFSDILFVITHQVIFSLSCAVSFFEQHDTRVQRNFSISTSPGLPHSRLAKRSRVFAHTNVMLVADAMLNARPADSTHTALSPHAPVVVLFFFLQRESYSSAVRRNG